LENWLGSFLGPFTRGIGRRLEMDIFVQAIDAALTSEIRLEPIATRPWSRTTAAEIARIAESATKKLVRPTNIDPNTIMPWCRHNGLVRESGEITPAGRVLCELRGRDAVELALSLGVDLSVGYDDPWRLGAAGLLALHAEEQRFDVDVPDDHRSKFHRDAMVRITRMGLAWHLTVRDGDPFYDRVQLQPEAADLVLRVATEPDSRFRALARALLDLERGRISSEATGRGGVDLGDMSYARSVAHEIRNLTLPLATGLSALWEELGQDQPDHERRQKLRQRIDRSLDRLNEFATEAVKLSAAVAEEEILLSDVVAEAVQATESERNGRIAVELREIGTRKIVGTRRDWSTAFINLLRNAAQSRAGKGVVVISTLTDDAGGLHIYVDDDGPGIPEELREQVFAFGHSTRGGSGLGLADARRTAQRSAGTLVCEASPQGGARFHFSLPRRSTA
jgi:signal transduction histidine kinase